MARIFLFVLVALAALHACVIEATPSLPGAFAALLAAVALALAASARLDAIALASGALGALASAAALRFAPADPHLALLSPGSAALLPPGSAALLPPGPAAAGALLLVAAFLERTTRVEGPLRRLVHLALAAVAGAVAASIFAHHEAAAPVSRAAALLLGGALLAAPLLLAAEDPVAHLLSLASDRLGERTAPALRSAAELRRWSLRPQCAVRPSRKLDDRWTALATLVHQRLAFSPASTAAPVATASYRDTPGGEGIEARQARLLEDQIDEACTSLRKIYGVEG